MANSSRPYGLLPLVSENGTVRTNYYYIPAAYGTALYVGDTVIKSGTSNSNVVINGRNYAAGSLPSITKATAGAGNLITGVIVGFVVNPANLNSPTYNPANTEAIALVCDDPQQLFKSQCLGTLAVTQVGLNANLDFGTADSIWGQSGITIDIDNANTTQNFQTSVKRLLDTPGNELGLYSQVVVKINQHTEAANTAGI